MRVTVFQLLLLLQLGSATTAKGPPTTDQVFTIAEDTPVGAVVGVIEMATGETPQDQIVYSATGGGGEYDYTFVVEGNKLVLITQLDYEYTPVVILRTEARLVSTSELIAQGKFTVHVTDVNDNAPRIVINTLSYSGGAELRENAQPGTFVAHVMAHDADSNANAEVTCAIDSRGFRLEQLYEGEYKIVSAVMFDHENQATHDVSVQCHDNGLEPLSSTVTLSVHVTDENDNAPRIVINTLSYSGDAEVGEHKRVGTFVANVMTHDADSNANAEVTCAIDNEHFRLEQLYDGVYNIVSAVMFDHEEQDTHDVILRCYDNGIPTLSATATITVHVVE